MQQVIQCQVLVIRFRN